MEILQSVMDVVQAALLAYLCWQVCKLTGR